MCLIPGLCQNQTRLACVQTWVGNGGASYVLVSGDHHYILDGESRELLEASTKSEVTVTGVFEPIPLSREHFRPASFLDFFRPTTQLSVISISAPAKKHHQKRDAISSGT